jgi:peptide/nickel transport system substrate-binding protein
MKTRHCLIGLVSFLLILISVNFQIVAAESLTKKIDNPQYGGTLKIIFFSGIRSLGSPSDASRGSLYNFIASPQIEALVRHDNQFRIQPRLAEKIDVASDGKSITFYLRKGITFQDGTAFNAAAVEYALKNYTQNGVQPSYIKSISSYDLLDEHTIRLKLKNYNLNLLFNLVWGAGFAVSPQALQKETTPVKKPYDHMIGSGAFKLVDYERDVKAIFKKNSNYWQQGKPYLDGIEFRQISLPVLCFGIVLAGGAARFCQSPCLQMVQSQTEMDCQRKRA